MFINEIADCALMSGMWKLVLVIRVSKIYNVDGIEYEIYILDKRKYITKQSKLCVQNKVQFSLHVSPGQMMSVL